MTTQSRFDKVVGGDGCPLTINLKVSTLVNELPNWLQVWYSPSDVRFANSKHIDGGLVQFDENTIVDLSEAEKLQNLADLWGDLVDTTNTHDKGQFGLGWDVEVASLLGLTGKPKFIAFTFAIFLDVLFGTFEDIHTLFPPFNAFLGQGSGSCGLVFLLALTTLQDRLGNRRKFFVRHIEYLLLVVIPRLKGK